MAEKNARLGNKSTDAGAGNPGTVDDSEREIERLIADGGRETDGESSGIGNKSDGSDDESGDGGDDSERGTGTSERSARRGGDGDGESRTRTRTRNSRGRSRNTRRSSTVASEEARTVANDVSRTVEPPKKPKIELDDDIPSTSAEIIADSFQFIFWGIGQATGLDDWDLDEDDAKDIGRNGDKWLKSLGKKRASNIVKGLNKIGPSLAFFGSIGMAIVPRVRITIKAAKDGTLRPIQTRKVAGGSGNPVESVAPSDTPPARNLADDIATGRNLRPFRPEDFSEISTGFAGQDDGAAVN